MGAVRYLLSEILLRDISVAMLALPSEGVALIIVADRRWRRIGAST